VSITANNGITAGFQEIRSFTVNQGSGSCTQAVNPLAINVSGTAYNLPNYILDTQSGSWGLTFPTALYYVTDAGFGNCDSSQTPFCERTTDYVGYTPHYANANGGGSLNGGSATASQLTSFTLADEYQVGGIPANNPNSLVWFDNCGYGSLYTESSVSGRQQNLPQPPNNGQTYIHTIENDLGFPVVLSKECCASFYQQNTMVDPLAYEPPQQIDNSYGIFIAANQSLTYETIFNDEAMVVYGAGTGSTLFKLRLHPTGSSAVYSCSPSGQHAGVSGSGAEFTVTLGSGSLGCGTVGLCPFPMSSSTSDDGVQVTCTTTESSFILGLPDWKSEISAENDAVRLVAWGGSGQAGPESACNTAGGATGPGGVALTVQNLSMLPDKLYAYVGNGGGSDLWGGSSTVLATTPLSTVGSPQSIKDPSDDALLVAGGGGAGGETNCIYEEGMAFSSGGGAGGDGGVAISNANPAPGVAVSVSG
ncbi:MAG: hypothetical protein ACRDL7_05350, partial [Gaiellaceae bacterium]